MALWNAFKNQPDFARTQYYPTLPIYLNNIADSFSRLTRNILNTFLVAGIGTIGVLFISSLSSYAFARMNFPGRKVLFMLVMALMMVPGILTLVPSFMLYKSVFGLDNYAILIFPMWVGAPLGGIFLLRSFFEGIPETVFEAARIDGAKEFMVYAKICLPLSLPILGTMTIIQVTNVWNDYFWPMITIKNEKLLTVPAALFLKYATSSNYPLMYANYLVASIPLILLFVIGTKYYVEGLTSSALKL